MTTANMTLALLWHFRFRLYYPLVATEVSMYGYYADILAIRKRVVEVEIKQKSYQIKQDMKSKSTKHLYYLKFADGSFKYTAARRPNKFYFALPYDEIKKHPVELPEPYGLIAVKGLYNCITIKPAKYLTTKVYHLNMIKDVLARRLTAENIHLRGAWNKKNRRTLLEKII